MAPDLASFRPLPFLIARDRCFSGGRGRATGIKPAWPAWKTALNACVVERSGIW